MPSKTPAQQRLMGADLARKRAGKKTVTGMTEKQLEEFAAKPKRSAADKTVKDIVAMSKAGKGTLTYTPKRKGKGR